MFISREGDDTRGRTPELANIEQVPSDSPSSAESPDRLRDAMVAELRERGAIRSSEIAAAFAKVPREKFAPEAPLSAAYPRATTPSSSNASSTNTAGPATTSSANAPPRRPASGARLPAARGDRASALLRSSAERP
ncbi:hypothetical protein [Nonomuraea thailandensis]|uniref:hypothetical protein n=1 Tax=Nonomuraea thailandensis TaxID=1188745 RepID=UPI0035576639